MKLQAQLIETETEGFDDAEEMTMETTDPAVIQIMLENIYPDPYVWPRELLANWMDAGGGGEVILPSVLEPNWIVEDHGAGMTDEFMRTKYTKIFHSTKRDNNSKIGGFGHGRLSPLAYTDSYTVRSRFMHEGKVMEGNYLIFKGENKIPRVTPLSLTISDVAQTGVTVTIPIGDRDIKRISDRTAFFASYLETQPKGFKPVEYLFKNSNGGVRAKGQDADMAGVRLIVGGIPYPAPRSAALGNIPFDLFFEVGSMSPTLDRGAINGDETTLAKIKLAYKQLIADYRDGARKIIDQELSVLDRYAKYIELSSVLDYGVRSVIFDKGFEKPSTLDTSAVFAAASDDFNLHEIFSDIDKSAWRDLDVATKTLRSLTGIKIKSLVSHGTVRRRGGNDLSDTNHINFQGYVDRHGNGNSIPQIAIFAVKLPYITGQIKLIKEAIAAELTKQREATTNPLSKSVKVILIQYEKEADVKAIADLISPKIPVTMITDNSKRAAGSAYVSVITAETTNNYPKTRALKANALANNSKMVFYLRPDDMKANPVFNIFDALRFLPPFKDRTLVAVTKDQLPLLTAGYQMIEDVLLAYLKKQGYTVDRAITSAYLGKAQTQAKKVDGGILRYNVKQTHQRFWQFLEQQADLISDPVIAAAVAVMKNDTVIDTNSIAEIDKTAYQVSKLVELKFFTKPLPALNRPLPPITTKDTDAVANFLKKFPLITQLVGNYNYNYSNYGIDAPLLEALIDYFQCKQPRN